MTNQEVLHHAKCSVAILVDRGLTSGTSHSPSSGSLQHVAILFFGGPDDREALGLSKRFGIRHVSFTVIRFHNKLDSAGSKKIDVATKEEDVLMAISSHESENDADNTALTEYFNRYVVSGQAGYVEKQVQNANETASLLRDMTEMYSMFIVGRGDRGNSALTTGLSACEESPELGKVGDFLASSEFDLCGSILVVQQHGTQSETKEDDVTL